MKQNVLTRNLTSGATYDASMQDYYTSRQRAYEQAKRQYAAILKQRREYERLRKNAEELQSKEERTRKAYLEKLKQETSVDEREKAAVRALEKWGKGETPSQLDADLFEISDYKKMLTSGKDKEWHEKALRKIKDFFLSADGITATGWKMNDILASLFSGNIAKSREDQLLLNMAEAYFKGNKTPENALAVRELNRRKPGFLNSAAVYVNKALDWIGNNSITGTTGAFLGTDELDKVRINIDFDENTSSLEALLNIAALRNSYKALDEESYKAYLENHNKARYYENMLSNEYKRKVDVAEGRIADENGVIDGSVEFFNFSKLSKQLPGIIAGSISSPSLMVASFATGALTAAGVLATTAAATAATVGTGGLAAPAVLGALTATGAAATFGLNQAQGAHENAAEVDEGYVSKVKYALDQHPGAAADFYKNGRSVLGKDATEELIIVAKLANKIPATNKIIDKAFDDAAVGSQRQYDRDMVATTGDSTIDTALQITPLKFFSTLGKSIIKANLRSSRIARAANKVGEKLSKLNAGDDGVLRKAFGKYGALVSGEGAAVGALTGTVLDNTLGRIPKVNNAIKAMAHFDIPKIKKIGPKASNWINYGESILGRGLKSAISEGVEEGKLYYNQQRAVQEFLEGLKNGNLSYETQTILGDLLDDFQAGNFAASGLVQAITGIPMLDALHYTDTNIINAAEAIKNIKSGMIGGHGQTTAMTAMTGFGQTVGTHRAIDDLELAIRALEESKLSAQKQFAQDQILSRTNNKHIASAIDYLKNSNSIKLSEDELNILEDRAREVSGLSKSPYMKALSKELNIPKENYHEFVADYMYHKDNLETERENLQGAARDLDNKANEIHAESLKIANPSDAIYERWQKNDTENDRRSFESEKSTQIKKLKDSLKALNDKLEKEALTNSEKAEILKEITSAEEQLKKVEDSVFDNSKTISYAQARFNRINTLAKIHGAVKQLRFLNGIYSSVAESNVTGRQFVEKEIKATKKLLNGYLTGNVLRGKQLTADNLAMVDEWSNLIKREIERADQDNMNLMGASAELSGLIESLALAYQEYSEASLNYNIARDLFKKFVGYDVNEKGDIVPEGTEGSKHIKGNAKEHLEGIISAQDDDAKLEQAYQQGFADYGFSGVYKNESPVVQDEERQEEEAKPGTTARRLRIKELGNKIIDLAIKAKNYVSGKWQNFGYKRTFVPNEPEEQSSTDSSNVGTDPVIEGTLKDYFSAIADDLMAADDAEKWLDNSPINKDEDGAIASNALLYVDAYLRANGIADGVNFKFGDLNDRVVDVYYKDNKIGTITPTVAENKASGNEANIITLNTDGFDLNKLNDESYLKSLTKPEQKGPETQPSQPPRTVTPVDITDEQEAKIQVLTDLTEKMNNKFDTSLRTSSHYFEWVGEGENRKLKLWHRLHDEIGSHFGVSPQDKKNWSDTIKKLYSVVYHKGYENETSDGVKDIQALLDYLQSRYHYDSINEELTYSGNESTLDRINGYVEYLKQEGDDISDTDLYECIKGISEEIIPEIQGKRRNIILDRGTAVDALCRVILGTKFSTPEEAIEYCKTLTITNQSGIKVFVKDYFTDRGFEEAVSHLWNTRKVYVEDLGYVLWTAPFTIYTEDFTNEDDSHINIAGEIDMLAIDKEGNSIIVDYKTSKYSFFENGKLSTYFTSAGDNFIRSPYELYTNQLSAYIQMLNETTRKETAIPGGFNCTEARLLPIKLVDALDKSGLVNKVEVLFSKDLQLSLHTIPFKELGEKEGLVFDNEKYRVKLAELSRLYARVEYFADRLNVYFSGTKNTFAAQIQAMKEDLDSIQLALQEITYKDLKDYRSKIDNFMSRFQELYFDKKTDVDEIFRKYKAGELKLDEFQQARSFNNIDWDNPLYDNDINTLGGFAAMGVKDRKEYDEKVNELAHVACNKDFQMNSSAKLTAVLYKTRQGNDKISVYASITYKDTTYPPIRLYLSENNGLEFAKAVLDGNTVGGNIQTTIGLLSRCSDNKQHAIGENKQLVKVIRGTDENPYSNFMVDVRDNMNVAVVTFNKSTGVLSTVAGSPDDETVISLPKTLKNSRANGHIIINITPENSDTGKPIPIICNTPEINETLGVDKQHHRNQSLLDFLVEDVLQQLNDVEGGDPLNQRYVSEDYGEIPLTLGQILNFFFEPYNSQNGTLVERPQYEIYAPISGNSRLIKIGNFSGGAKTISLDDIKALKEAIGLLNVWISTEMASVKWNSSKRGSKQFNEFAEFLKNRLEDGEKFYLGGTNIYFDKSDADGTYLGFLAKNMLLTTPFNGFSHPLISINTCQKEGGPISPVVQKEEVGGEKGPSEPGQGPHKPTTPKHLDDDLTDFERSMLNDYDSWSAEDEEDSLFVVDFSSLKKLQNGKYSLDETAARLYIERVLGKSFADKRLLFVDEISSAIVGGLSVGTIIAGQVTANMMKLSKYAQNGVEYHETFHWAFELILDPKDADQIRNLVRKKYKITDEREIAEWLADAYMRYIERIYTPKSTLLRKALNKIKLWAITFAHMFTGEYQLYKLFNSINSGKFANKPINNKAVLRFLKKFKELNEKIPTNGFEKDGFTYRYQQGPVSHEEKIKELVFFALRKATFSPAVNYIKNRSITINVKNIPYTNYAKKVMMLPHKEGDRFVPGFTVELLLKARENPKLKDRWNMIDSALAVRELLDDEHIDQTQKYVAAYVDRLIGVKGRDLSVDVKDDGSLEAKMDDTYGEVENGENSSFAGSPAEHIIPDHQISRVNKTSSRIKLFFSTVPMVYYNKKTGRYEFAQNRFGNLGYYEFRDIYNAIQNKYHHVLSPEALWKAMEADSHDNNMVQSLYQQIVKIKELASKGNNNAIGLLNEIYKNIKSTKLSEEVTKTRYDNLLNGLTYRPVNIMEQKLSFAISREFTDRVFGNQNKFYQQKTIKDDDGKETWGVEVRPKIFDEYTGKQYGSFYRELAFLDFFSATLDNFVNVVRVDNQGKETTEQKLVYPIYNVITSFGSSDPKPFYLKDDSRSDGAYREVSLEKYIAYVKYKFVEALSAVGIDLTTDLLDDILETQFGGTGVLQLLAFLTTQFRLTSKYNPNQSGNVVTVLGVITSLFYKIDSAIINGKGIIKIRKEERGNNIEVADDRNLFRNQEAHVLFSILLSKAQQAKYEVVARGVDGKLSYALSDDNTVTAMCDVVFDKTGDPQCTEIRQMLVNDPFNMSNGLFRSGEKINIGSFILPHVNDEKIDYEIVRNGGIETGNNENSSTSAEERGADTIISTITRLCQNMIVLAPFADKSTALSIRLTGIKIPGLDYSNITYEFRDNMSEKDKKRERNISTGFKHRVAAISVDDTGRVELSSKDNKLDEVIAGYVLAEYYQAKKAIQDYEDLLRNHAIDGSKTEVEEKYKTALNICKKLMFMSQFSGDYVQVKNEKTKLWEWTFKPFSVENGANKSDLEAAKEMLSQFEALVCDKETLIPDRNSLLSFVNRHINGLMDHELKKLLEFGIVKRQTPSEYNTNPRIKNVLLDKNIIKNIFKGLAYKNYLSGIKDEDYLLMWEQSIRIFMYDIVGKSIISKQESERLFTGLSDLYEIVRDPETRIITIPYQDLAKRIGSFASTGSVGAIEDEDYICAEIKDDKQSIQDQVERSIYVNEIAYYAETGGLNMDEHPGFDMRFATNEQLRELIPKEFRPLVDKKIENVLKGFVLKKKNGDDNKNNVTDGAAFISANFAKKLLKLQGAWDDDIAAAFDRLTSDKKEDIYDILNDYKTFNKVWTQVIGMYKYTAVGFRTENINGQEKVIPYVDKYALAPVFACMCNDKMDAIRRQMEAQNVDVLMFESCVKVGAHGNSNFTVDDNGNVTGEFNTYSQKSFFLRKQLNTDPNEEEIMKIGIQTVKVALSAVIGEEGIEFKGLIMNGSEIIDEIMHDINALTKVRREKLMRRLGADENGNVADEKKIIDYVASFLRGNSVPEPIIKAFLDKVPAEALSIQKHIDTLSAKRILEDIVRINTPGSAFILRCVYGIEGPAKFGNLELNDGEPLNVVNSDGSMDCVLSIDYFVEYKKGIPYFKLTPKGQKRIALVVTDSKTGEKRPMSFEEIRQWLKSNNIIGKNAKASILSYRIPTQAVASINALKCVDVIPVVRDTIVLPKLFTTITGADFDIDKLFISTVWYSMEELEDESYKPKQLEDDSTEEGLSNTVVNDYIDVLCTTAKNHPEIFYMSIDQDTKLADDVIAWIKGLYPPTEEDKLVNASGILHSMPSMQAKVHDEFLAGRQGIGPFALALVNHVLTRIYGVEFNPLGIYLDHKSLAGNEDDDGNSIMAWLSAMINKHVDVAKNPDITYLNVNDSTFNVVALLLRLGYGKRTFMFLCQNIMRDYAFAINQETAVCKYTKNDNDYVDVRQEAYDAMIEKYNLGEIVKLLEEKKIPTTNIHIAACREIFDKTLEGGKSLCQVVLENKGKVPAGMKIKIGKEEFDLTDKMFQYLNLLLFNYLSDSMAMPLSALQQATVIDNERCISSMIQSELYKLVVDGVKKSNKFTNLNALFENSYIESKLNASVKAMDVVYNGCSCIDKAVITTVAKAIDPKILSYGQKRMLNFLSTVRDGMVAYYASKFFDDYCKNNNINRQELLKVGKNSIVRRLAEILSSTRGTRGRYRSLRNNVLLKSLSIEGIIGELYIDSDNVLADKHRFLNYQFLNFKYADQSDDNMLADVQLAWLELLDYPDKYVQTFARDLIVYAFYTSGEMSGKTKLFKYVPSGWRLNGASIDDKHYLTYSDFFKELKNNKSEQYQNIDDIIDKLCRNLWYKDQFVRKIGIKKLIRFLGAEALKNHKRTYSIKETDEFGEISDPIAPPIIAGIQYTSKGKAYAIFKGDTDLCPRYLKCPNTHHDPLTVNDDDATAWVLYKLVGFKTYTDENQKDWSYPVYIQTSALGEKYFRNNTFEYSLELEKNENLDAYGIVLEYLEAFKTRKATASDVKSIIDNLTNLLSTLDASLGFELFSKTGGNIIGIAEESADIIINKETGDLTFLPLKTKDEFLDLRRKITEAQMAKFCNL